MQSPGSLDRLMNILTASFFAQIAVLIFLAAIPVPEIGSIPEAMAMPIFLVVVPVLLVSGFAFWISLGMLAAKTGRSGVVWVGLSFITAPIGSIIAYSRMLNIVKGLREETGPGAVAQSL